MSCGVLAKQRAGPLMFLGSVCMLLPPLVFLFGRSVLRCFCGWLFPSQQREKRFSNVLLLQQRTADPILIDRKALYQRYFRLRSIELEIEPFRSEAIRTHRGCERRRRKHIIPALSSNHRPKKERDALKTIPDPRQKQTHSPNPSQRSAPFEARVGITTTATRRIRHCECRNRLTVVLLSRASVHA